MGGELVRITSSAVSGFVAKLISTNIWIALNDVAEPGSREFQFVYTLSFIKILGVSIQGTY